MTKHVDIGDNLSGAASALDGEMPSLQLDPKPAKRAAKKPEVEERVRILLEDNDEIPPGGQFIQVNGRSFLIQAGYEVEVPRMVLDVLDHAVKSVPITDNMNTVIGYRDRLRFPYRVITSSRGA
jgi:hypothetical protein